MKPHFFWSICKMKKIKVCAQPPRERCHNPPPLSHLFPPNSLFSQHSLPCFLFCFSVFCNQISLCRAMPLHIPSRPCVPQSVEIDAFPAGEEHAELCSESRYYCTFALVSVNFHISLLLHSLLVFSLIVHSSCFSKTLAMTAIHLHPRAHL